MQKQYSFEKSGSAPIKSLRSGAIQVAIWENQTTHDGQQRSFHTVTLERRYKDKDGNWKSTNSLRINDLPKATLILQKAYEYLVLTTDEEDA